MLDDANSNNALYLFIIFGLIDNNDQGICYVWLHMWHSDVIMGTMTSQITSLAIVYLTVNSGTDQKNTKAPRHWPLWEVFAGESPNKGPVTRKMFPFDDVIMPHFLKKYFICSVERSIVTLLVTRPWEILVYKSHGYSRIKSITTRRMWRGAFTYYIWVINSFIAYWVMFVLEVWRYYYDVIQCIEMSLNNNAHNIS